MLKIIGNYTKYENFYESPSISHLSSNVYTKMNQDKFCKLYKEYSKKDFPKFARITGEYKKFITEEPIENLIEELKKSLSEILKFTNDKRVREVEYLIKAMLTSLNEGKAIINEIDIGDIDKSFMNGVDIHMEGIYEQMLKEQFKTFVENMSREDRGFIRGFNYFI